MPCDWAFPACALPANWAHCIQETEACKAIKIQPEALKIVQMCLGNLQQKNKGEGLEKKKIHVERQKDPTGV